jgi:hypothetical protein
MRLLAHRIRHHVSTTNLRLGRYQICMDSLNLPSQSLKLVRDLNLQAMVSPRKMEVRRSQGDLFVECGN